MATDKVHFPHIFFLPATTHAEQVWQPPADIYLMPDGWLVKLELAGVCPDDVKLVVTGSTLLVQGTRRDQQCFDGAGIYRLEIAYCRFERTFELPGLTAVSDIVTSCHDGMLLVRIKTGGRS